MLSSHKKNWNKKNLKSEKRKTIDQMNHTIEINFVNKIWKKDRNMKIK